MLGFERAIYGSPEKKFFGDRFPPPLPLPSYLRAWMTRPLPYLKGLDPALIKASYLLNATAWTPKIK